MEARKMCDTIIGRSLQISFLKCYRRPFSFVCIAKPYNLLFPVSSNEESPLFRMVFSENKVLDRNPLWYKEFRSSKSLEFESNSESD